MTSYDSCSYCGGRVQPRLVTKPCWWGEQMIALVENVPAGVCEQCGERYYAAEVFEEVERLAKEHTEPVRTLAVPVRVYGQVGA